MIRLPRDDSSPSTVASWAATPMLRRMSSGDVTTSWPATAAVPSVGRASVVRMRMAVVFPAPLWPRRPSTVPRGTETSRSRSAHCSP